MAVINKTFVSMSMPKAINRGSAIPLDASSVYFTYDEMAAYAASNPIAYVGQILSLVDSENSNQVTAYIITDEAGSLQEVGSATLGDNKTIVLDTTTGALGLKNWGVQYYRWDSETGEHALQVVDEEHPWIAGLEPKATTGEGGVIEIAWYEPSTTTIEDVSSLVSGLQSTVAGLSATIGTAEDTEDKNTIYGEIAELRAKDEATDEVIEGLLSLAGGTMTGDITLKDGSIAASEAVVDTKISAAIGSAGHLKREVVEALPEASAANPDIIYMIKKEGTDEYLEYILITVGEEKKLEKIGDTAVNLDPYMMKVEEATAGNIAMLNSNGEVVDGALALDAVSTHIEDTNIHITADERTAWDNKVDSDDETYVSLAENAEKLAALPAITEIGSGLSLVDGVLTGAQEYVLPVASTEVLGGVKVDGQSIAATEEGVISVKVVAENGLSLTENGIAIAAATENSAGVMTAEQFTRLASIEKGAQVNVIEGALLGVGGESVAIEEKNLILPVASELGLGLVKGTTNVDGIAVAADGTMSVNKVSTSKLYVPEGDELILNGGSAQ